MHLEDLIIVLINHPLLHGRWLNTLSYLENCGARLISFCEHPKLVKEDMMKHAAEEFRHAFYIKKQIPKVTTQNLSDYSLQYILGGMKSFHYLLKLNSYACRYLKNKGLLQENIPHAAYWFVTYAIELRAEKLYPTYHAILKKMKKPLSMKCIIMEEKEHLESMLSALTKIDQGLDYAQEICCFENRLYEAWLENICYDISSQLKLKLPIWASEKAPAIK